MKVFIVIALLLGVCTAASLYVKEVPSEPAKFSGEEDASSGEAKTKEPARCTFEWSVKDDDAKLDFGHQETRDGDLTTGLYRVLLPNSVIQTVNYTVDGESGYVAQVQEEEVEVEEENGDDDEEEKPDEKSVQKDEKEAKKYRN